MEDTSSFEKLHKKLEFFSFLFSHIHILLDIQFDIQQSGRVFYILALRKNRDTKRGYNISYFWKGKYHD